MTDRWFKTRRLLLRSFPGTPEVEQFARRQGWPTIERVSQLKTTVETMWDLGPVVTLHCVDDGITGNAYVFVSSEVAPFAEAYLQSVEAAFSTWSLDELFQLVDQAKDPQARGMAIIKMTIAAPLESNENVIRRMTDALAADDAMQRDVTLWAMSICSYPEFRPLLRRAADNEPEQLLRRRARALLVVYDKFGVPEP
ncbi:MAG TPA: hypothetical protein VNO21_04750 [Polyangiaceae bacterium]|nr:hypothetical protein [Polyangiaceae bacterium]